MFSKITVAKQQFIKFARRILGQKLIPLEKIAYDVTIGRLFKDNFQGFYFENSQQIFYRAVV